MSAREEWEEHFRDGLELYIEQYDPESDYRDPEEVCMEQTEFAEDYADDMMEEYDDDDDDWDDDDDEYDDESDDEYDDEDDEDDDYGDEDVIAEDGGATTGNEITEIEEAIPSKATAGGTLFRQSGPSEEQKAAD